jgi:hypothetical protein
MYVIASGPNAGADRLAFITNILTNGKVSLTCLPDAANDRVGQIHSATNVPESNHQEPGTWHWPSAVQP